METLTRHVILCDEQGSPLGTCDIHEAHSGKGKLHRAFSVFVFTHDRRRLLLQKRQSHKLFGNLWTNSWCSHPRLPEDVSEGARKRGAEECGIDLPLLVNGSFVYRAHDAEREGSEYEFDTVFSGFMDERPIKADPREISDWRWLDIETIQEELRQQPTTFTPWFPKALDMTLISL